MLTAALLGFLLGLRHASDPDHVVAVSAIVARHRRPLLASWIGVAWGVGHGLMILAVGAAIVALNWSVPRPLALGLEGGVGVVLVALGVANLRAVGHGGAHRHAAVSSGAPAGADPGRGESALRAGVRAAGVGLVHGLAGSAAVALLALAAMPGAAAALAYLAVFSLGTIAGMVAISLGVGAPLAFASRSPGARRWIVAGSGALSLGAGAWIVWEAVAQLRGAFA